MIFLTQLSLDIFQEFCSDLPRCYTFLVVNKGDSKICSIYTLSTMPRMIKNRIYHVWPYSYINCGNYTTTKNSKIALVNYSKSIIYHWIIKMLLILTKIRKKNIDPSSVFRLISCMPKRLQTKDYQHVILCLRHHYIFSFKW